MQRQGKTTDGAGRFYQFALCLSTMLWNWDHGRQMSRDGDIFRFAAFCVSYQTWKYNGHTRRNVEGGQSRAMLIGTQYK